MHNEAEKELQIRAEQLAILFAPATPVAVAHISSAVMLVYLLWDQATVPHKETIFFALLIIAVSIVRLIVFRAYKRASVTLSNIDSWAKQFQTGSIASGVAWALTELWIFPELDETHQLVLVLIVGGIAALGTISLSAMRSTYLTFIPVVIIPVTIMMLFESYHDAWGIAFFLMLMVTALLSGAERNYKNILQNITLRIKSHEREAVLEESEKMHQEAQRLTHLGHWKLSHENGELFWSDEVYRIFEIDAEQFDPSYDAFLSTVHPDDRELVNTAYTDSIKSRMPYDIEHRLQMQDGSVKWVNERCETVFDEYGNPLYSSGTVLDISERKQADQLVRKLSQAINYAGESILITDRNGIIEYANPSCEKVTGYTVEEVVGNTPGMFSGGNQDAAFYKDMWATITSGQPWRGKVINRKKDGSLYPVMLTISPIHDQSGDMTRYTHFVGIQSDLTKIESLEHQFYQAQKMEAIGTLVSGVSHDFNNMLSGIMGNVYFARKKSQDRPDVMDKLGDIDTLALHASEMIKQLLIFAREDSIEMQRVSLTSFMEQAFKLARSAISKEIHCSCDICQDELFINGDVTQIQQILMNLMNNARDALSNTDQAEIICSLSPYIADDQFLQKFPELEGTRFAHLSVKDNGSGIPAEKLDKIFDPFFTTKKAGEGTGLGLAMIHGAIQSHKGVIEVESECARGTTFHIYLPLIN